MTKFQKFPSVEDSVLAVVVLAAALHGAACDTADTSAKGSGSFTVVGTGEAVRPETPAAATGAGGQIKSKAQYTRTAIHVARSLDPSNEETMTVRTRTGDVATLIVKRRQRTGANAVKSEPPPYPVRRANATASRLAKAVPAAASVRVPDPVNIQSSTVLVKPAADGEPQKRARSMVKVDSENIPVIEGVRVPDDENDKKYNWRGARVINNVLVPNNGSAGLPAEPLVGAGGSQARISAPPPPPPAPSTPQVAPASAVVPAAKIPESLNVDAVKKLAESTAQSPWIPTSPDGANVVTPQVSVGRICQHGGMVAWAPRGHVAARQMPESHLKPPGSADVAMARTKGPKSMTRLYRVKTPKGKGNRLKKTKGHKNLRKFVELQGLQSRAEQQRRILEYIRAVNQLEAGRAASRGRMMRNTETPAEARSLHYQPALLYSAQSTNPTRVVSFEEGVRTPVLQYAHPELGVQPAKVAPPAPAAPARSQDRALAYFGQDIHADRSPFAREPGLDQPEEPVKTAASAKRSSSDGQTLAISGSSTPTSTGLPSLPQRPKKVQPIEDSYGLASDKYIKRFPHAASYKDYRDYKDDYGYGYRYNSYRADPHYGSYSPAPFLEDARPFWVRLSDSIQDSMRTGMERMSDLARPVVDPLVEASAKISQNLGFTSGGAAAGAGGATRGAHGAQDRLGSVGAAVATPSMLLPALGLVAGGAALGLGAVAVGRYLDVDVMAKRSEASDEDDEDALEMEHKRALNALRAGQQRYLDASQTANLGGRQVTDADVVAQVVDVINQEQQHQQQHHQQHQEHHQSQQAHSRARRDSSANTLDSSELAEERRQLALRAAQLGAPTAVWGSTPCAQRVFCDVLSREGPDSALLMEKKMATLLAMLPRVAPEAAAVHLSAVMGAVRRGDCSVFVCPLTSAPRPRR
ncbi:Tetraacyldisaccharide 4'-kinase [Frankliniella fusca]|uniref:Tetraacyldisaccharide 4'-kinase n=1 Tax=Frankliniella fusca TaxID=407009 RepID=A0AAE1HVI1_9NEOP|nr:Tetraacyldisaccharide 4'-kinase [Frankliniella fusca]